MNIHQSDLQHMKSHHGAEIALKHSKAKRANGERHFRFSCVHFDFDSKSSWFERFLILASISNEHRYTWRQFSYWQWFQKSILCFKNLSNFSGPSK